MKKSLSKITFVLTILLFICFIISIIVDYINYDATLTSFPFYTNIIVRGIEFLLPSIICLIISFVSRKKK